MKTIAKLYKEYRSIFEMSAFICLLALLLIGTWLISYVGSAKADTKISSDCVYYNKERLATTQEPILNMTRVCVSISLKYIN